MGGLLFGYDWVVIGGAKPFYEVFFSITGIPSLQGWAMSSALVGCVAGAMMAGGMADKYGRKWLLIIAAFLFVVPAYDGTGAADSFNYFIFYRILGGIGIGLALIYALMGSIYYFHLTGLPVLVMVVMAIAVYAMSLAPITWVILSEIFPNRVRGRPCPWLPYRYGSPPLFLRLPSPF
jgi:MFS family permease